MTAHVPERPDCVLPQAANAPQGLTLTDPEEDVTTAAPPRSSRPSMTCLWLLLLANMVDADRAST